MQPVYILSAKRTPIGAFLGTLASVSAPKLGAAAIAAALENARVQGADVGQVIMGCVLPAGVGQAPARQAAIFGGLPQSTPCTTINKVCGSGMKAIMMGAQSILTDESNVVVVGGMENMSQVPFYVEGARNGYRMGNQKLIDGMIKDGLWDVYNDYHMGSAAELCAREYKFSREEQDRFSIQSFKRAQAAIQSGAFKNEIVPVKVASKKGDTLVDTDEGPGKAQFDKIPSLKPVFQKDGTVTAANASTINDGACALVLASEAYVKRTGAKPLAKILGFDSHAQAPEWFTTAPVEATRKVLKRVGWSVDGVDLFEVNEAFAVVALAAIKELGLHEDRVNVNGGAVSLGHPIGASGARIVTTLVHALLARGKRRGVAAICIGGGEATAMCVETI